MIAPPAPIVHTDAESDSDWDDDDDFGVKKINIKIKPIAQVTPNKISASVDELRATVETWKSIANVNLVKPRSRRHHQSTVQLNDIGFKNNNNQSSLLEPSTSTSNLLSTNLNDLSRAFSGPQVTTFRPIGSQENLAYQVGLYKDESLKENFTSRTPFVEELFRGDTLAKRSAPSKPSSSVQSKSSSLLKPEIKSPFGNTQSARTRSIPVALAIQEIFNARLARGQDLSESSPMAISITGRLKMAVPKTLISFEPSTMEENLILELHSELEPRRIDCNSELCRETSSSDQARQINSSKLRTLAVDMRAVLSEAKLQNDRGSGSNYILIPQLFEYFTELRMQNSQAEMGYINPLHISHNVLHQENVIKLKLDLSINQLCGLTPEMVQNFKVSVKVRGNVKSCDSKPEAYWDHLESRMIWSFDSLSHLLQLSNECESIGLCLARFFVISETSELDDIDIYFSLPDRTISSSRVIVKNSDSFRVVKQKLETRVGTFRYETSDAPQTSWTRSDSQKINT